MISKPGMKGPLVDQTVTQSEDMRPWTGPEGKQGHVFALCHGLIQAAEISTYSRTQLCRCLLLAAHDLAVIHWISPLALHLRLALLRIALDLQL